MRTAPKIVRHERTRVPGPVYAPPGSVSRPPPPSATTAMLELFQGTGLEVRSELEAGVRRLTIPFGEKAPLPATATAASGRTG